MTTTRNTLELWLKANALEPLLSKLNESDVTELSDFEVLESEEDVNDLANELHMNDTQRRKFKQAVLTLISRHNTYNNSHTLHTDNTKCVMGTVNHFIEKRIIFNPGINMVSCKKTEYSLPILDHAEQHTTAQHERISADYKHKIILVCGQVGTGKSAFINSMVNYIYNVQYEDKFRLKLIEETSKERFSPSTTKHITSYKITKPRRADIDYDLTIVDTPGFGNCLGIESDMQKLKEFEYVFSKVLNNINGICFIIRAHSYRLSAVERFMCVFMFRRISNLWGHDLTNKVSIIMTFSDGKRPKCIDALDCNAVLKGFKQRLKINNAAFMYTDFEDSDFDFGRLFWDMGIQCFHTFFENLEKIETKQLKLIVERYLKEIKCSLKIQIPVCLCDIICMYYWRLCYG
eukprot:540565_1